MEFLVFFQSGMLEVLGKGKFISETVIDLSWANILDLATKIILYILLEYTDN